MEYYLYFDGDNVGNNLELFLIDNEIEKAKELSANINLALKDLKEKLMKLGACEIILFGGDDILIKYNEIYSDTFRKDVENLRGEFKNTTNLSISGGGGKVLIDSLNNLRKSKLMGKNAFIWG